MLKAALAQGMPIMVIAMMTAAIPQPMATHRPPNSNQSRLSSRAMGDMRIIHTSPLPEREQGYRI
jgi:hypothetical protein